MMRRLNLIIFLLLPTQLAAEIIDVQRGEHLEYTRLVMAISPQDSWQIEETPSGIEILIESATGFQADSKQGKTFSRIQSMEFFEQPNRLSINFNCLCEYKSYALSNRFLMVDIRDTNPTKIEWTLRENIQRVVQPWHTPRTHQLAASHLPTTTNLLDAIDATLSTNIALATYQGFLQLPIEGEIGTPSLNSSNSDIAKALGETDIGVRAQTNPFSEEILNENEVLPCEEISRTLINQWGTETSYNTQLGKLHQNLGETDSIFEFSDLQSLAMLFIGHGLGSEATKILSVLEETDHLTDALSYIAQVIDGSEPIESIGLENCQNDLQFWSFLADKDSTHDPKAMMMAFKLLPPSLQSRVIEKFADTLVSSGNEKYRPELQEFQNTIVTVISQPQGTSHFAFDFEATATPHEIIRNEFNDSDPIGILSSRYDTSELSLPALESLRIERRETDIKDDLLEDIIALHISDKNYAMAITFFQEAYDDLPPPVYNDLIESTLDGVIINMTDTEILSFAYRLDLPPLPDRVERDVKQRLASINLPMPEALTVDGDNTQAQPQLINSGVESLLSTSIENTSLINLKISELEEDETLSFLQSQELLTQTSEIRNEIATFIENNQ